MQQIDKIVFEAGKKNCRRRANRQTTKRRATQTDSSRAHLLVPQMFCLKWLIRTAQLRIILDYQMDDVGLDDYVAD